MTIEDTPPEPPARVTNDDLYRRSTQYKMWSFTKTGLEDLRTVANKKGIRNTLAKIKSLDQSLPEAQVIDADTFPTVSQDEELGLVEFFAKTCHELARVLGLPTQARATAISYLYKFYLYHSIMEYHPQRVMYTCLFLAAKTENSFIGIETFVKKIPKGTVESVLQYEYLILETLKFSLLVYHPYQALYGFYLDIQSSLPKVGSTLDPIYDHARELVNDSMFTDLKFLYTPPQIALACLWLSKSHREDSDDKRGQEIIKRYLAKKFGLRKKKNEEKQEELESIKEESEALTDDREKIKSEIAEENEDTTEVKKKKATPQEHYDKILKIINECVTIIREHEQKSDQSLGKDGMAAAKAISFKVRLCMDPQKHGKRLLQKQQGTPSKRKPEESESRDTSNGTKRLKIE